jgi:hypothetical protein
MKCQSFAAFLSIIWYLKPFTTAFVRISRLRIHSTKPIFMESTNMENSPKSANSEEYDVNHPQNLNTPVFNSSTDHRSTDELPGVENLDTQNQTEEEVPQDPERLFGSAAQTDLGNGERTEEELEKEKIIKPGDSKA